MRPYILILFLSLSFLLSAQDSDINTSGGILLETNVQSSDLLNAVRNNDSEKVAKLLQHGADPNYIDPENKNTPLMIAACQKNVEIARLLIDNGADVNLRSGRINIHAFAILSPLDYAVLTGDTVIVNYLLSAGANLVTNKKEDNLSRNNPVIIASQTMNLKMVNYLLEKGGKVSEDERRHLIVETILLNDNKGSITKKIPTNALLVRLWIDKGVPLSEADLLNSELVGNNEMRKQSIIDYLKKYSKTEIRMREELQLSSILNSDFTPSREQELIAEAGKDEIQLASYNYLEGNENHNSFDAKWIIFIIIGVALLFFIYYFIYIPNRTPHTTTHPAPAVAPAPQPQNKPKPQNKPQPQNKQKPAPSVSPAQKKGKKKKKEKELQPQVIERGWTKDDTVDIEVLILTIEDMINPIALKNEHEKRVKRTIALIRTFYKYNDEELTVLLGEKGLLDKLDTLWKEIKPGDVRSIYKRSLHLVVKNHMQRDPRVEVFLERIKK